jgi:glycosyltransferase involved in cell wall biosynthesis
MRVLWFTNIPMPAMDRQGGITTKGSGSWMLALLQVLSGLPDIRLGVVTAYPGRNDAEFSEDGVDYFVVGQPAGSRDVDYSATSLHKCAEIAGRWKPDVVHIHGTERFYGLLGARRLIRYPVIISIQGLITPCSKWLSFFGEMSSADIVKAHGLREIVFRSGLLVEYMQFKKKAKQERDIVLGNQYFMGRTDWDRAQIAAVNSSATYYHVDEMMRKEFFKAEWNLNACRRHSVVFTNIGHPRRGTETLLDAIAILIREFPDIELRLAGQLFPKSGYGQIIIERIRKYGLADAVRFLGYLDAETMSRELSQSHVFAITSYIENSPNSLCEAMLVGMPCVASFVGGIPSLMKHGEEGLFFPAGDAPSLAGRIRELFLDDKRAELMGRAARARASRRHDPARIIAQLLSAYSDVSR